LGCRNCGRTALRLAPFLREHGSAGSVVAGGVRRRPGNDPSPLNALGQRVPRARGREVRRHRAALDRARRELGHPEHHRRGAQLSRRPHLRRLAVVGKNAKERAARPARIRQDRSAPASSVLRRGRLERGPLTMPRELRSLVASLGWPGKTALALLAVTAVFYQFTLKPLDAQRESLERSADGARQQRADPNFVRTASASSKLAAFYRFF